MAENGKKGLFVPGDQRAGREKGIPNRVTAEARAAFSAFVEGNAERVQRLWDHLAQKDPGRALEVYAKLAEFLLPKLSRSTIDGEIGIRGKLVIND